MSGGNDETRFLHVSRAEVIDDVNVDKFLLAAGECAVRAILFARGSGVYFVYSNSNKSMLRSLSLGGQTRH